MATAQQDVILGIVPVCNAIAQALQLHHRRVLENVVGIARLWQMHPYILDGLLITLAAEAAVLVDVGEGLLELGEKS